MKTTVNQRVAGLLSEAMYAEDAEAEGADARELVADPDRAVVVLGAPGAARAARHAVVQCFGGVGALLVIACEESWKHRQIPSSMDEVVQNEYCKPLHDHLTQILRRFADLSPAELDRLVEGAEGADAVEGAEVVEVGEGVEGRSATGEIAAARRWLHVTYAIAARDGTDEAHRAYVQALDGVLAHTRALVDI